MQAQLDLFTNHLPAKARSCDNFDVDNKVRYLAQALKKRYIQPNDFNSRQWLVYDIDRPTHPDEIRHDCLAPEPTIFVSNPKNRHAHLFYLLNTPVHQNADSSQRALRFAAAVDCGMALKLDADMAYAGLLAKNAAHEHWEVLHTVPQAYELNELAGYVDTNILQSSAANLPAYGLHRNYTIFEGLRKWAYKAIRQGYPAFEQWDRAVLTRALALNMAMHKRDIPSLPEQEIEHIAKSVAKFTHRNFSQAGFSQWQAAQGAKGGVAKGKAYGDKRIKARLLRLQGNTYQSIADQIGASKRSIITWCK